MDSFDALTALGWPATREAERAEARAAGLDVARVARVDRGAYHVLGDGLDERAALVGGLAKAPRSERPVVGDWVALRPGGPTTPPAITRVLPRTSAFRRKVAGARSEAQVVAANVDVVFLAMGLDEDFNLRRLERMAVLGWESGARPVVVLTKADLAEDLPGSLAAAREAARGASVLAVSSRDGTGLDALEAELAPGRTVAVLGSSGVGKSTLVNRLLGEERMATRDVRASDGRGRHTTTHRELVRLGHGALLIDTPGMRELGLVGDEAALDDAFDDVATLAAACRFTDCRHQGEPGCAVRDALERGALAPARLESFRKLEAEHAHAAERQHERRTHERAAQRRYRAIQAANRRTKGD